MAGVLLGCVQEARSAVFEETHDGQLIAMGGGASQDAPLQSTPVSETGFGGFGATQTSVISFQAVSEAVCAEVPTGDGLAAQDALAFSQPQGERAGAPVGMSREEALVVAHLGRDMNLPKPRRMGRSFSARQREMRALATRVGWRYARTESVRKARLHPDVFVKLFTTLIQRESAFNPRAVSPVGAKGLGQLMPRTARSLGVRDPFSPKQNLNGAADYLTAMLDRFGSPELALAAYNAGPGAVRKYGGIPPYRETRQYVADILHAVKRDAPTRALALTAKANRRPDLLGILAQASPARARIFAGPPAAAASAAASSAVSTVNYVPASGAASASAPAAGPASGSTSGRAAPPVERGADTGDLSADVARFLAASVRVAAPVSGPLCTRPTGNRPIHKRQHRLPQDGRPASFFSADANMTVIERQPARGIGKSDAPGTRTRPRAGQQAPHDAAPPFAKRNRLVPISAMRQASSVNFEEN